MANKKLTDLTELTTPADGDFLYIVDVSDTTESAQGTSKKIRKDKVDSGASKENIANKQNSLAIDGTGTKYPTVDAVNTILPTTYSKVVYVNATSPTTATIFDTENPPVTNDNALKNDTANLYIGTDASTWVYLTGTGYVTKTVSSATSNFNTFGTSVDAGNSKTSHITRSGAVTLTGPLNILNLKIATTPTTSAGSYDILTRNSSTTALEKKLLSDFVQVTGAQSIQGRKSFTSTDLIAGGVGISNSKTTGGADSYAISIYNTGGGGIYTENTTSVTTGNALAITNASNTGVGLKGDNFGAGNLITLRNQGGTGDLLYAELGKVTISSAGKLSTTELATTGNNVPNKTYVDAKITQTITNGVTDKSPSEDAVYDALANVSRSFIIDNIPSTTVTGTVSETILKSYLIPENTFSSTGNFKIPEFSVVKGGNLGALNIRIYINTSNTLTGAVQIARLTTASTAVYNKIRRSYNIYSGNIYGLGFTVTNLPNDIATTIGARDSTPYNVANSYYIITTATLANTTDSVTQTSFEITN